jgi:tRNA (guanine37-N1)-methyltransferase
LLSPQGRLFSQSIARELAGEARLTLLCGHYEGFDERIREHLATDELSIGDYVLTGGELAAMVIVDAVARLLPGVLAPDSTEEESHTTGLLEYPHYTRPPEYRGWGVPEVLLSGNHAAIARWRRKEALRRTRSRRPDLLARAELSALDRTLLAEIEREEEGQEAAQ